MESEDIVKFAQGDEITEPKSTRKKIGRADQRRTRKIEYLKSADATKRRHKFRKYVVLVRTLINEKGLPDGKKYDIKGPLLQQALTEINKNTKDFSLDAAEPVIDPHFLFHSRRGLQQKLQTELVSPNPDPELIFELEAGLQLIQEEFATDMVLFENLVKEDTIKFDLLWMLFPPNTLTLSRDDLGQQRAVLVQNGSYRKNLNTSQPFLELRYMYLDHDGESLGSCEHRFRVNHFSGLRQISAFPYVPLSSHPNPDEMKKSLLEQSRNTLKFHGKRLVEYSETALKRSDAEADYYDDYGLPRDDLDHPTLRFHNHGRVMLDPVTWKRILPGSTMVPGALRPIDAEEIGEEQLMIVTPMLYGFSLGDKTWGAFATSRMSQVDWDQNAFKNLVLADERKALVHDLVLTHSQDNAGFDDFIRYKGRGLIGQLGGPPGVGKTMTAEAIAETTHRPLYTIASGELGDDVRTIQAKLKEVMELAESWSAVLLLDEADTMLCERNDTDLTRNAIVSIFLRELEYYQGIMILTTNRAGSIDPAFRSRIHFSIEYPDLTQAGRRSIWRDYLKRAQNNSGCTVNIDDEGYDGVAAIKLNGREIRNTVSVSVAIAKKRGEPITISSIQSTLALCQSEPTLHDQGKVGDLRNGDRQLSGQ